MLTGLPLLAAGNDFGYGPQKYNFDPSLVKQWKEAPVSVPAAPASKHLVAMPMGPTDTLKVFVDRASVSRGEDGVLRLTLVVQSPGGARNVFYDGIRCETREYKTYAISVGDARLEPLSASSWQFINILPTNAFRWQLFRHHACDGYSSARSPREFLDTLK